MSGECGVTVLGASRARAALYAALICIGCSFASLMLPIAGLILARTIDSYRSCVFAETVGLT